MELEIPKPNVVASVVPSQKLQAVGAGMVVSSTVAIAIVPTFAKFAFDGGSNTLTIITGRSILSIVITLLLVLGLRQPLKIARRPLLISLAMGVDYAIMLYGYLGAVQYLPVNLVILIYFIHPLLVGIVVSLLGQERLRLIPVLALVAALAGLGLAIGFSFDRLDIKSFLLIHLTQLRSGAGMA